MTISEAQNDWRVLDEDGFEIPEGIRLISHEAFDDIYTRGLLPVEEIKQCWISRLFFFNLFLSQVIWAFQILYVADKRTVIFANGSTYFGNYICLLNYYIFFKRRTILFWDSHIEPTSLIKKYLAKRCFMGCSIATLWSKKQSVTYSTEFDLPVELFIFIPYKATHSKVKQLDLPVLDFVFSGGNGKRDYASLVEAVRGTKVTLVISATRPEVLKTIGDEPNIIPLAASEPSYSKLMASSRFVVVPMVSTGLKGGGETNYCNAMWHSKAVIAMDEMSADDYIIEGKSGYIVPHRDVVQLKKRILELWNDKEKSEKMGAIGKTMADKCFTQVLGIRRLVRLACLLGKERIIDRNERL